MATVVRRWGKPYPTNRSLPLWGGLGWVLPAYRRCPVAIPVSFQNFRVRVGYAATHPTHEIHHRVRLGAPSGAWRRLCDGGASPTLRTVGRPFMADSKKNVGHECPTYNLLSAKPPRHRVRLGAPSGEDSPPEPGQAAPPARNFVNIAIQCPESHDKRSSA